MPLFRRFTDYLLAGRLQAVLVAFVLSMIPFPGGNPGSLVACLVTLRKGALEGCLVFFAILAVLLLEYLTYQTPETAYFLAVITGTGFVATLLMWFFAVVLRHSGNWSLLIEIAVLSGILSILLLHMIFPGVQAWWAAHITAWLAKPVKSPGWFLPLESGSYDQLLALSAVKRAALIQGVSALISGVIVTSMLFGALLQLVVARWWEAAIFAPGELRAGLHAIRMGRILTAVFLVLLMLATFVRWQPATDCLSVLLAGYAAAGLSLVHAMLAGARKGWLWLTVVYAGAFFYVFLPLWLCMLAMFGLLDAFFDFRRKLLK